MSCKMRLTRSDIRFWLIAVGLCLSAVALALWLKCMPKPVSLADCDEVYKRYKDAEGIRTAYVKDYRVNDTLSVAMALLEAETDSAWAVLVEDFDLPPIPKEVEKRFVGNSKRVSVKYHPKQAPLYVGGDTIRHDLIVISRYEHRICHFVIASTGQLWAITDKIYDDNVSITQK